MEKFETNRILVSGTGKMGLPLLRGIDQDGRYILLPWAISDDHGFIQLESKQIEIIPLEQRSYMISGIRNEIGPFILIDAVPKSASQANIDFFSGFENMPLIAMSSGINDQSKSRNTLFLANACLQIMAWEKFIAGQKENMFSGEYSLDILEAHQETKEDVSNTAIKMVPRFTRLGLQFEEKQIVTIRGEEGYLRIGIPRMFWGAHAFHKYTITSKIEQDMRLRIFFSELEDFLSNNVLFRDLFYFESDPGKSINYNDKTLFWGNDKFEDTPYRTFMFSVRLVETENQTKVEISHSIFGHQPYVEGVINQTLPFMQEKCMNGLNGENFTSLDLYDWAMNQ